MKLLVIKPGERGKVIDTDFPPTDFQAMQKIVEGYVEQVHTNQLRAKHNVMLVDEDGRSKGKARNLEAERISAYAGTIVGTVAVCGEVMGPEGSEWSDYNA